MTVGVHRIAELSGSEKRTLLASVLREQNASTKTAPASYSQERLWFLDQLQPGTPLYNMPAVLRLPGPLSIATLERCLNEIVRRHEVLRTTFDGLEGRPVQRIAPRGSVPVGVVDLERFPTAEREPEAQGLASIEARRPFDLAKGPLVRCTALRLSSIDHILLLTLHHVVSDGWSMNVFFQELSVLYQAYSSGRLSPLAELPVQYADFARWQREQLRGEALERQLQWWRELLAGAPPVLELPADWARPPISTHTGATEMFHIGPPVTERLKQLSQREGVTLFMTLVAAFQVLLARYSGQYDMVIGTPVANRTDPSLEPLIGFFVNTLLLRTSIAGNPSFGELLKRVKESTLGAYAHQDLPFEKLVEELQPERSLNRNPLFQVMIVLQNAPGTLGGGSGGETGIWPGGTGTAKFDLTLFVMDSGKGLVCALEYSKDIFDADRIRRMASHFSTLAKAAAANPNCRIGDLPLLPEEEREQVVSYLNARLPGAERLPHEWFEAQVDATPYALAVVASGVRFTYSEINCRANRIARYVRRHGIGPEVRVGVSMERCSDWVAAVLAVLKAGGVYVPIDPGYPEDRRRYMAQDASCAVVLTGEELDRCTNAIASELPDNPPRLSTLDNLAYVIYTSGSTGRPKGVAMHARPLANLIAWQIQRFAANASLPTLQFAPASFDVSFQEIITTLGTGGTLWLASEEVRRDPRQLHSSLAEHGIGRVFLPFVALHELASANCARLHAASSVREVITAGEQLQITPALRRLVQQWHGSRLYNQYGPSETHVVTEFALASDPDGWAALPPIGTAIPNVQVFVLDERLHPAPIGIPGEIYVGGVAVARGYIGRPDTTSERFVPNPFATAPGERLYRTGDQAVRQPDGNIAFLGRLDTQVKIRGHRVELGEIETLLASHPEVRAAAVATHDCAAADRRLVAYVVLKTGEIAISALREFVAARLPEYMTPALIIPLDELPRTPSGKLDRRALPHPDGRRPDVGPQFEAPRDPLELELAEIWSELLGVKPIGLHDNFFELGGHSLLVTRLVGRVREAFHVEMPLQQVFAAPSIAELSRAVLELELQAYQGDAAALLETLERNGNDRRDDA